MILNKDYSKEIVKSVVEILDFKPAAKFDANKNVIEGEFHTDRITLKVRTSKGEEGYSSVFKDKLVHNNLVNWEARFAGKFMAEIEQYKSEKDGKEYWNVDCVTPTRLIFAEDADVFTKIKQAGLTNTLSLS